MEFFTENWYLFVLALGSGALLLVPSLQNAGRGSLAPAQAVYRINREKAVVVDVREPQEFATGHIANSRNIPLGQIDSGLPQSVKNKALPVILVCTSGPRAVRAEAVARKLGYEKAQALAGGLKGWRAADLPVVIPTVGKQAPAAPSKNRAGSK